MKHEELYTASDIAKILRVSTRQVAERYAYAPGFPRPIRLPSQKGQGMMRWIASEITDWIQSSKEAY